MTGAALSAEQIGWIAGLKRLQTSSAGDGGLADEIASLRKLVGRWQAVEAQIEGDLSKLRSALKTFFEGDDAQASMEKEFEAHVGTILTTLDTSLKRELDAAAAAKSMDTLKPIKAELRQSVAAFSKQIGGDETIALFDENPYVKLTLRVTCVAALDEMAAQLGA